MNYPFRLIIVSFVICLHFSFEERSFAQSSNIYDVGVSDVNITPDYPIRLNGFGFRRKESEGVSQQIHARAIAISQAKLPPLVLVTIDSLGVRTSMVDEVKRRLKKSHQLPEQNLALTFTHSHCAPKVNGASDNIFSQPIPESHQKHIDRYTKELTNYITEVAQKAIDSRKPAKLDWAVGKAGFGKNRRPGGGPVDHDLPMMVVRDPQNDKIRAIYVSYACHCVTLSFNKISGDWAGYAAEMIERSIPGAVALVSIGAGSDQNPSSGVTGDKVNVAEQQGIEIATEVKRLLSGQLKSIQGIPASNFNIIDIPLQKLPTRAQLIKQTNSKRPAEKYNATTQLARLDNGQKLLSNIAYPIQTWTFGKSLCMTFLAGEVCVDYSLQLKSKMNREHFWLNAYSNDFCCYIPSERLLKEGGYGGGAEIPYFALPTALKTGVEKLVLDEVYHQVPEVYHVTERTGGIAPKSPQKSIHCMKTHQNLKIELIAAEPQVVDPVAIDFGFDSRLWVVEMNNYGRGVYEKIKQGSRVRWLKDEDGDGYFEKSQIFMDDLRFPTDIKVWRDGILVCDAPHILFIQDKNDDGIADVTTKLFSGFEIKNAQARVNSLRWGLDNWLHGSGGMFGGTITNSLTEKSIDCNNRDFRLNPDTGSIEPLNGRSQHGRDRNDWGEWFGCTSGSLFYSISSEDQYAPENPSIKLLSPRGVILDTESNKLYPPENLVQFELSGAPGKPTAACGLGIYRDSLLGPKFLDDAFTCEPVQQLVHRIDLSRKGHSLIGQRGTGEESSEFLSSTDQWFRPVQARTGPDGALWVVDMYRYVIEHPRWIDQSTLAKIDVFAGKRYGRIYRVLPKNNVKKISKPTTLKIIPDLANLNTNDLVKRLNSTNGPLRDLVQQMLIWNSSIEAVPSVRNVLMSSSNPAVQIQTLSTLAGLKKLTVPDIIFALKARNPEVVRFAIRSGESFINSSPELQTALFALKNNKSVRVRRQLALSIGKTNNPQAPKVLAFLIGPNEKDAYVRSAALSSIRTENINGILNQYIAQPIATQNKKVRQSLILRALQLGDSKTIQAALNISLIDFKNVLTSQNSSFLAASLDALDSRKSRNALKINDNIIKRLYNFHIMALNAINETDQTENIYHASLKIVGRRFGKFTQQIIKTVSKDDELNSLQRAEAIATLISPKYSVALQKAAITAIGNSGNPIAATLLLDAYPSVSLESRLAIIDIMISRKESSLLLLSSIQSNTIRSGILDANRRSKLLSSPNSEVRTIAKKLLNSTGSSGRASVLKAHQKVISMKGNIDQGREVFQKRCSTCHKMENHGYVVGPDLMALTNRDPKWLLTAILDPNKDVDARYTSWIAVTEDGRSTIGMNVKETSTTIHLKEAGGKEHVIARAELDEFQSTNRSMMPEGLERDMTPVDISNVIAYLGNFKSTIKPTDVPLPRFAPQIAPFLLDEFQPQERRIKLINLRPGMGHGIVSILAAGIPPDDIKEEYVRIPWIWRVSIAAAKRNNGGEIGDLLKISMPSSSESLRDWQAVVIGGGLINGLTQIGVWPNIRIEEVLSNYPDMKKKWSRTLKLSATMADDKKVKDGTRYDALRMVALLDKEIAIPHLLRYLTEDTPFELQMGAVSGLVDINSTTIIAPLIKSLKYLKGQNRHLAIEGLLRTDERAEALKQLIGNGDLKLSDKERQKYLNHALKETKFRANKYLKK